MAPIRVIAGKAKGRQLYAVPGGIARPIQDKVKESLFNIISVDIRNSHFLDLFAGTGGVGIEALSRGADRALLVDKDQRAVDTIRANLEITGFEEQATVLRADIFNMLILPPRGKFDYVYIAPPQYKELWDRAVMQLDRSINWLNPDAWIIAQMHPKEYRELELEHLQEFDQRLYGRTLLVFYIYLLE